MRLAKTPTLALLLLGVALAAAPAFAQEDTKSAAAAAKVFYQQGVDLAGQQKWAEAEAKFLDAWNLQKSYDVAANLGEVSMQLEKPAEAAHYLTFALANFPASGKQDKLDWITNRLKEAKNQAVTLTVSVNVPGAEVRINGKPAGKAPVDGELYVAPGDCTIEITAPDHEPFTQTIRAPAGSSHKVKAELTVPPINPLPAYVVGGAGVLAAVAGIGMLVVSNAAYDEAKALHGEIKGGPAGSNHCVEGQGASSKCADLKSAAERSDALYGPGLGMMIGGLVLTAAGGAYLAYALKAPSSPSTGGRPAITAVGLRGTGVIVQGSF